LKSDRKSEIRLKKITAETRRRGEDLSASLRLSGKK